MNSNTSRGLGVLDILQIIFIVLKLLNLITWSWWVVFTPLWISLALVAIVVLIMQLKN